MWAILKDCFQYIFPITVTCIFSDTCNVKLSDYRNIIDYISCYQITYNKIFNYIRENLTKILKKTVKLILEKNLLKYFDKDYLALMIIIKTK